MEEYLEDTCLHIVASRIFSDVVKTGDPEAAGLAYAEFFARFKKAYSKRHKEMMSGDEEYRYGEIFTSTVHESTQQTPETLQNHVGYDPEAARILKEQQQKQQPPDSTNGGRSF